MLNVEKKMISFVEKHYLILFFIILSIFALMLRYSLLDFASSDFEIFLKPWFQYFRENGIKGLANYPGDYNAPYMTIMAILSYFPFSDITLIKSVSIIFDFILAMSCAYLTMQIIREKNIYIALVTYLLILFLPQVILNSSMWAQCDSIYVSFIILSIAFLIRKKYLLSFIFLGLSFSFKLQCIFILPLYIILYFRNKNFSVLNFLIIPIIDVIMCLPAIILGKPIKDCLLVYFLQTNTYSDKLVMNFTNIYQLIPNNVSLFYKSGEIFVLFICAFMLLYCITKKINFNEEKIITLGLWFLIVITYFLPGMHERYLFLGEIMSIIYLICYRKNFIITILININSFITYSIYLNGLDFPFLYIMSLVYLICIIYFTKYVLNYLKCEE